MPAPRSTPTPGRGTRSASPAPHTPAATSTPASTPGNGGKTPTGSTPTRCRSPPAPTGPDKRTPTSPARRTVTERDGGRCRELLRGHQGPERVGVVAAH